MPSFVFFFAYFLWPLVFPLETQGKLPLAELQSALCIDGTAFLIDFAQDHGQNTTVQFTHSGAKYTAQGTFKGGKPTELIVANRTHDVIAGSPSHRYLFVRNLSGYVLRDSGINWRFIGYNQDWIRCPQSLCVDGSLDAATDNGDDVLFFSGAFFWRTQNESPVQPLTGTAREIQGLKYVDAAYCHHIYCYLVKGGKAFVIADTGTMATYDAPQDLLSIDRRDQMIRAVTDVAAAQRIFIFLESVYGSRLSAGHTTKVATVSLPTEWHDLDAAFVRAGDVYLLKRWTFFRAKLVGPTNTTLDTLDGPSSVLDALFGCNTFTYPIPYRDMEDYRNRMKPLFDGQSEQFWTNYTTLTTSGPGGGGGGGGGVAINQTGGLTTVKTAQVGLLVFALIVFFAAVGFVVGIILLAVRISKKNGGRSPRSRRKYKRTPHNSILRMETGLTF